MVSLGLWQVGFTLSAIAAVTFLVIGVILLRNIARGLQWRQNPLAVATMAIFLTCGIGHLIHTIQLIYPLIGGNLEIGAAAQLHYQEWHLWVADGLTAAAGSFYLFSRRVFPQMVSGAALYENAKRQQSRAVEIHDNVVQGIVKAKWALDLDDEALSARELESTLEASKQMVRDIEAVAAALERQK